MIKVIKHGQKEFNCACPRCGCEFTYEYEDIHTEAIKGITYSYSSTSYVVCPDCKYHCEVPGRTNWPPFINEPIPTDQFNTPSGTSACHECEWWKKITQPGGFTYVGDTPCTWCSKGPYKILCDSTSISSNSNNTLCTDDIKGIANEYTKITCGTTNKTTAAISGSTTAYGGNIGAFNINSSKEEVING
jgi:hypothetical protein